MKWAFVDCENVGKLNKINFDNYTRVILFVGVNQHSLCFGEVVYNKPIEITYIRIMEGGKNNLDFHLNFYLGDFNQVAPKDVIFEVISNDQGFSSLIKHINAIGRSCSLIKTASHSENSVAKKQKYLTALMTKITNLPANLKPKTITALKNYILSCSSFNNINELELQRIINELAKANILTINDQIVKYG